MPKELYDSLEIGSAFGALSDIQRNLPEPFLVLGGWGVYLTVNKSFEDAHGTPYLGSRDIDVCFHIDSHMNNDDLRNSTYARAIDVIRKVGYIPQGSFRFYKIIKKSTGNVLTEEEAKKEQFYDLFYLYLDIMVDNIHPRHEEVFGCKVLDEPILARVFDEGTGVKVNVDNIEVIVPPPHILLASKLKAIPGRDKEDKQLKDACDIYAILWHSPKKYGNIISDVRKEYPKECVLGLEAITIEMAPRAADHLGIDVEEYLGVVMQLGE